MVTWLEMHETGFMMNQSGGEAFQEFDDRKADYRFNKHRLRGKEINLGKVNVLTIGDSFTFGLLLNEEQTYVHLLQEKADEYFPDSLQFLNGGIGGSGLGDWPGWLDTHGIDLDIDYLVYFMNSDDINRALSKNLYVYDESLPDSLEKSQRWTPRAILPYLAHKKWYRWIQANSQLGNIVIKLLWRNLYFKDLTKNFDPQKSTVRIPDLDSFSEESDYSTLLGTAILDKIENWCTQNGCEFIVITTGFFEEKKMSMYDQQFYKWYQLSSDQKENFFDNYACVQDKIISSLDEIKIPGDSHPNEEGAQIIANCTWEKLITTFENN
ncbi:MAG: hypothetical protein ED557_12360 [Balneola sp.]|nr:MAG: hypothetical protein ED557_12360 [Balneola sp.]